MTRYVLDLNEDETGLLIAGMRAFIALSMDDAQLNQRQESCGSLARKILSSKRQ